MSLERGCVGKVRHPTKAAAKRAAKALHRRDGAPMNAYKCVLCDAWHVGHKRRLW